MAGIQDRLDTLESIQRDIAALPDRLAALEDKLKGLDQALAAGETHFQFLQQLPDGRGKAIQETTDGVTQSIGQMKDAIQAIADPFNEKLSEISKRIKALEGAIGVSS
jgi:prefoldin subunit 5